MSNNQRLFYGTWAMSWLMLALCASVILALPGGPEVLFNPEAWFITFPVAWTIALLVVRYQDRLKAFFTHPSVKRLYMIPNLVFFAWSAWDRGVRKGDFMFKTLGILMAASVLLLTVCAVVEAVQSRKRPSKVPVHN